MVKQTTDEAKDAGGGRLREILGILAKHKVVLGMTPEKLRAIVEDMGPTFVKLGQIMSMRRDMLPAAYCAELGKLRAQVRPMPFDQVRQVIEEEYRTRLGRVFASVEEEPLGSASIAQVHAATLLDGKRVVIKVQRPGIREVMARDIALLHRASRFLRIAGNTGDVLDFDMVLDEMWAAAQQEMDFLIEAENAEEFYEKNRDVRYVSCPKVERKHTTSRVLVMEYVDGAGIIDLDTLRSTGYDLHEVGEKLAASYVKQVIDDGFFHADPHPGNIRVRGGQLVFIDMGMMGRLSDRDRKLLRQAVEAVAAHDVETLSTVLLTLGVTRGRVNHAKLYEDIDDFLTRYGSMELGNMDLAVIFEELMGLAKTHQISLPKGISMLGRGVLTLEGVLSTVSPEINLVEIMANQMSSEILGTVDWQKETVDGIRAVLRSGRRAADVPAQLSDLLRATIKGQTKLNFEVTGSEQPLGQIDRMVNKLIACILAAALLVGSCLICTTDMTPRVLDIPVLGLLGFLAALILGGWILISSRKK